MSPIDFTSMSEPRHFLVNLNYAPGTEFMRALLSTGEFTTEVFRRLGFGRTSKDVRVEELSDRLVSCPDFAKDVLLRMCQASRTWLYFARLPTDTEPDTSESQGTALDFLTKFGTNRQWYGPFTDGADPSHTWYVRTEAVQHYIEESTVEGENPQMIPMRVRWHVVAMVGSGYIALHWNNFSHVEKNSESAGHSGEQFPYWQHIPGIRDELLGVVKLDDAKVEEPVLYDLVLNQLLEKYEPNPAFEWKHLRVRAEQNGVAMNARSASAKASEHDLGGVRRLTHAFAMSAALAIDKKDDREAIAAIERALLRTFIREWGTVSYEFELNENPTAPGEKPNKVFRGHVYFGERAQDAGPDGLPHCKCFQQWGGSNSVLDFILEHL